jgi:hypothetical protein
MHQIAFDYRTRVETTYILEVEREDPTSDCGYNYKMRAVMTYGLKMKWLT